MLKTQIAIGSGILALTVFWLSDAQGNLGDTLSEAEARGKAYKTQYGAVAPLFHTDANGKVIWECWAAPPEQWTKDQALEFARQLIRKDVVSRFPVSGKKDGSFETYTLLDGTIVILQFLTLKVKGSRGDYIGLEVRSPTYTGPKC